jgi:hypothetical protein
MIFWDECDGNHKEVAEKLGLPPHRVKDKAKSIGLRRHSTKTVRKCMTCRKEFFSDGIHDRICSECKKSELYRINGG